ncbi:uncharacterized protein EI90DRAFT_3015116 [Cantharellus anzutake]|uniref:uncharacterized protein n=1 Tax=Cantharellus anzutake TaxID=1750568 RepID=UPI001908A984|nr:uncharacterized protein EI90DRAFT_3015116 [Cantharellus anzutake]KAF8334049.1 hypothetical protein EI90DRAFT_3015116 [Cantharellus anzutake]
MASLRQSTIGLGASSSDPALPGLLGWPLGTLAAPRPFRLPTGAPFWDADYAGSFVLDLLVLPTNEAIDYLTADSVLPVPNSHFGGSPFRVIHPADQTGDIATYHPLLLAVVPGYGDGTTISGEEIHTSLELHHTFDDA